MSTELITRNADLNRLRDEGFDIDVKDGFLLLRDVPYLDSSREIQRGTLICELTLAGDDTTTPKRHTVMFSGEYPYDIDGAPIKAIECGGRNERIIAGLTVCYDFSAKKLDSSGKKAPYSDHYEKMVSYVRRLTHPAQRVDPGATARTYSVTASSDEECPFEYLDTASARAGITQMQSKLVDFCVGIVGVGGTGSYVLDLIAKAPVQEIHLFDDDFFLTHNAFRSPGAASISELRSRQRKVEYYSQKYSVQKRRIISHIERIDGDNVTLLDDCNFVFLCLDAGAEKAEIVSYLETNGKPFIDVGIGVTTVDGSLRGSIRTTTSTENKREHIREKNRFSLEGNLADEEYSRNTQIVELNAINASLAVIRWKKLMGFYLDQGREHHSVYRIGVNRILNEDTS